ncbi:MAG TPA: dihydrolipoamide acetyltransferase family protein, partial [Anaerolineae bacterium]|nr:dihydrolipoamide acetyltransferase family protein [Anaerolineae bacterium]
AGIRAGEGDVIPVGQTIAWILAPGETVPSVPESIPSVQSVPESVSMATVSASPLARRIAEEHGIDIARVKPGGGRVEKADVLAYLTPHPGLAATPPPSPNLEDWERGEGRGRGVRVLASPKARRLAVERGLDLATLYGSGPGGAVLAADVPTTVPLVPSVSGAAVPAVPAPPSGEIESLGTVWRVMAERMTGSWTSVPHFYLMREILASGLVDMRARILPAVEKRSGIKPSYTDLLVKLVATALRDHPRLNASWVDGGIRLNREINIGIATAIEEGLIVPVIHGAEGKSIGEIAARRNDLVMRANENKLRLNDIAGGTFTITNLGMYNVDVFNAIVNPPQAAILAVGRITDRVVAVNGQPAVRPTMIVTLSCDHRVVDGARAAKFLDDLANLMEEPWGVLA